MKENETFKVLQACVPKAAGASVDWQRLERSAMKPLLEKMSVTKQNPEYHGEGDVLTHTKAVCEELIKMPQYLESSDEDKTVLFLGALFHDVGKPCCTKLEDGQLVSPYHAVVGALITREFLWKTAGLCGDERMRRIRESVCNLVRYHSFPHFAIKAENAERKLLKIAANAELASSFSLKKLCLLERADTLGRICSDADDYLEKIDYCELLAEETGCAEQPYSFPSAFSERSYFLEKTNWRDQDMFKDTWGEIVLLSGLPGTGKDTWLKENYPDLPMISLDEIRKELRVSPTDHQGAVIAAAHKQAKEYLRKKQPFVWNATSITAQLRAKQISLFERYNASVKTVFLETEWEEELLRNAKRSDAVPQSVIEKMLSKLEPPERFESETVLWKLT